MLKDDKKHLLIQAYSPNDKAQSVFKVNIYKNQFNKLFVNKYNVSSWVADQNSEVVLGVGLDKNDPEITNIYSRANGKAKWR